MAKREPGKHAPPGVKKPQAGRPGARKDSSAVAEAVRKAAHEAVERAERGATPSGTEYDRTPPGFERE